MIVGVFVLVGLCALGWMVFKFGGLPLFVSKLQSYRIEVCFPRAPGVEENTPVRFGGYQIGRVARVEPPRLLEDKKTGKVRHQIVVTMMINRQYDNIPADAEVNLMTRGLGSSYISIRTRPYEANEVPEEYLSDGSVLQGSTEMASEFFPEGTQDKLDQLITSLQRLIVNANDIIGDESNKENFKSTLANLSKAAAQADKTLGELQILVSESNKALTNTSEKMQKLLVSVVGTSNELSETLKQVRLILVKVKEGKGSAGKFVNDGRLYENLLETTNQLQKVLAEVKAFITVSEEKGLPIKLK